MGEAPLTLFGCTAELGNLFAFYWHPHVVPLSGVVMPRHACLKGLFEGFPAKQEFIGRWGVAIDWGYSMKPDSRTFC